MASWARRAASATTWAGSPASRACRGPRARKPAQAPVGPAAAQAPDGPRSRTARAAPDQGTAAPAGRAAGDPDGSGAAPPATSPAPVEPCGPTTARSRPGAAAGDGPAREAEAAPPDEPAGAGQGRGTWRAGEPRWRLRRDSEDPRRSSDLAATQKSPNCGGASFTWRSTGPSPASSSARSAQATADREMERVGPRPATSARPGAPAAAILPDRAGTADGRSTRDGGGLSTPERSPATSLHMEGNKFHGEIPESWHLLVSTQQINLSHNDLSGAVPEFFGYLGMLEQLDLSYNNLGWAVPTSGIFENSTAVVLDGNKGLCSKSSRLALPICPSATKTKHHLSLLLISLPPLTIALLVLLWFLHTLWKRGVLIFTMGCCVQGVSFLCHHKRREVDTVPCHDEQKLKRVSYQDILKATNWFSSLHTISSTCTGSVYVGRFKSDRRLVAIKVFNLSEPGGCDRYFIECEVLRSTRHRNIMRPVTVCSTLDSQNHEFKALIFKFMVNGSLDRWLHSEQHSGIPGRVLNFGQRICIAADVASALDYIHNQLTPPLIHCDLKPENILLDDDMTARLSDFGSAKFLSPCMFIPESLDDVGGTVGYMAPEYGMGYEISVGADAYSFGVLLLELLTGKRPTDDMFVDGLTLPIFSESMFPERVAEILDPRMGHEEHQGRAEVWTRRYIVPLVALGLSCTVESPKDRPGMKDVCAKLSAIRDAFLEHRDDD